MNERLTQKNYHNAINNWRYHRTSDGLELQPHWHTHYELLLVYKGYVRVFSCGKIFIGTAPCVILYRPFTLHGMSVSSEGTYERSMINFSVGDMALFSDKLLSMSFLGKLPLLIIPLNGQQTQELDSLFGAIFANLRDFTENRLYIALIIHKLYCVAEKQGLLKADPAQRPYISDVLQYLSENLGESLRLKETASRFQVGRTKLNNDLRQVTGMTLKQYLTSIRMVRARELVEEGVSVAQTAMECGYNSESNFIAAYRRHWGETPGVTKTNK